MIDFAEYNRMLHAGVRRTLPLDKTSIADRVHPEDKSHRERCDAPSCRRMVGIMKMEIGEVISLWFRAIFKPSEQTYINLSTHPKASFRLATSWVVSCMFIYVGLTQLVTIIYRTTQNLPIDYWRLLAIPLSPIATFIAFNLNIFVTDYLARLFGAINKREKLSFAISSLYSPAILILWVLMITATLFHLGITLWMFSMYVLILLILIAKVIYQISWLKATVLILISSLISIVLGFPLFGLISLIRYL